MAKLRAFLDAEAKRNAGGNGIKPTEPGPIKIRKPTRLLALSAPLPVLPKGAQKIQGIA